MLILKDKQSNLTMSQQQPTEAKLQELAKHFSLKGEIDTIAPLGGGFINSTFIIKTKGDSPDYILQKKNKNIFKNVPAMMDNIVKVTEYLRARVEKEGGDPEREVMRVVSTPEGNPYVEDSDGEFWAVCEFIPDTLSYESASNPDLARKGGEGIGKFLMQLADFNTPLYPTIEGFHDLAYRFGQWDNTKEKNLSGRADEVKDEIEWVEKRKPMMKAFWSLVEKGVLPKRVTHNDTKLSNILFDKKGNVQCVIDLDTVMSNTALADYGDAIRSFANSGEEDDRNLENVSLNKDMFRAYTEGYLSRTKDILSEAEKENLFMAPLYITYEQVMRFLMDYIDGDTYYKTSYPGHNLVRTRAQMKLMESMEENIDFMKQIIKDNI